MNGQTEISIFIHTSLWKRTTYTYIYFHLFADDDAEIAIGPIVVLSDDVNSHYLRS